MPEPTRPHESRLALALRRLLGWALLAAAYAPIHRLLDPSRTGLAGAATRASAESVWTLGLWGTVVLAGAALALSVLAPVDPSSLATPLVRALRRPPLWLFAASVASVALTLSLGMAWFVLGGRPTSVDEMVQLLHAEALLGGSLALPLPANPAAWMVQNSVLTPSGWASVYPPLHTLALAAGSWLGAPWVVGPVAAATTAGFSALALVRLFPDRPGMARAAAALVAVTPFGVFLAGTYLSHATAAALCAATLWAALKARDEGAGWSLLTGATVGAFVCARPWTGMALSTAILLSVWGPGGARAGVTWSARRAAGLGAGGSPFALLLLGWNQALFSSPFRLGYTTAFGPAHGLGFGADPWGNAYGPREALAHTGADLVQLGLALFESPLPALALVGLALALAPRLPPGSATLLAWALAGVGANALYWHHGLHMGPRLLYETAPAWVALWVVSAATLAAPGSGLPTRVRRVVAWAAILSLGAGAALAPGKALTYRMAPGRAPLVAPGEGPALIFAHGSWASRVSARLAAAGMRRDSLETALRRNDLCAVDAYSRWRAGSAPEDGHALDLTPRPGSPSELSPTRLSPGNVALLRAGAALTATCLREARADRLGTFELEPLLWLAPPLAGARVTLARDLGPADNAEIRRAHPGATPFVLVDGGAEAPWRILSYEEGMELVWGGAAGVTAGGG